jgi:hypothetical protein
MLRRKAQPQSQPTGGNQRDRSTQHRLSVRQEPEARDWCGERAMQGKPPHVEAAEAHYRAALAVAKELGMRPLQAHGHLGVGKLYAESGRREKARAELSTAIDLYRTMDMTFWLPQAAALAQVEGR